MIKNKICIFCMMLIITFLSACSKTENKTDPYKPFNQDMFNFNLELDQAIVKPVAKTYKSNLSDGIQEITHNILSNTKEPYYAINYLLSWNICNAAQCLFRFVINSTIGAFGIMDVAEIIDLKNRETSYKETMANLGFPTGDYIVLPVYGASSERDVIIEPISWFIDPVSYFVKWPITIMKAILIAIDDRSKNYGLYNSVLQDNNAYPTLKSIYEQQYKPKSSKSNIKSDFSDSPSPD